MLRVLALILCLAGPVPAAEEATVGGEVEKPGTVDLSKGATLKAVMESAMPFQSGARNRIRVFRHSRVRVVDLKKVPDFRVEPGDVIDVPQKVMMEGCGPTGVGDLRLLEAGVTMEKLLNLLAGPGREVRENWRMGMHGVEVRPEKGSNRREWDWVFIRILQAEEIPAHAVDGLKQQRGYRKESVVAEIVSSGYPTKFNGEVFSILKREAGFSS